MNGAILSALNQQILHQQTMAHAYHAISLYFGRVQLPGLGAFMERQMRQERRQARKLIRQVANLGEEVELGAIPAPKNDFASPLDASQCAQQMERTTTEMLYRLNEMAGEEKDGALEVLLNRLIAAQARNEKWTTELTGLIEQFHDRAEQMLMLDAQWARRARRTRKRTSVPRR
jgi:ferritin